MADLHDSQGKPASEMIEAYLLGELDVEQTATLDRALREDAALRRQFASAMQVMSLVRDEFRGRAEQVTVHKAEPMLEDFNQLLAELGEAERNAEVTLARPFELPKTKKKAKAIDSDKLGVKDVAGVLWYLGTRPKVLAPLAAVLALALTITIVLLVTGGNNPPAPTATALIGPIKPAESSQPIPRDHNPTTNTRSVATLTAERDAVWDRRPGEDLYAGQRFTLSQGFAEITTARGAVVILEAPASIELTESENAIRLHKGKIVGMCHTEFSKGFTVLTEYGDILDLGTEFGVEVFREGIDLSVFVGEVAINRNDGSTRYVQQAQTAKIRLRDNIPHITVEDRLTNQFARRLPRNVLVYEARLNFDQYKVAVVPQGVYEDARVSTDRNHEINGLDASGIPPILLGGDLVQMPHDAGDEAPANTQLELELDISRPAEIYLVMIDSVDTPDWLLRDYEKTAMRVGLDMVVETELKQGLGTGPGKSIDKTCNIWKRKTAPIGKFTAAYNAPGETMYSIIVVPADERRSGDQ